MVRLTQKQRLIGHEPRKRVGWSKDYGEAFFGFCMFGLDNNYSGIYQKCNAWGQNYFVKTLMKWPANPQSVPQQANRSIFADAILAWRALDTDDKIMYEKWGRKYRMSGYNKFISEYMKAH